MTASSCSSPDKPLATSSASSSCSSAITSVEEDQDSDYYAFLASSRLAWYIDMIALLDLIVLPLAMASSRSYYLMGSLDISVTVEPKTFSKLNI